MESIEILDRKFRLYIPEAEISAEVNRLASELTRDYQGKDPLLMPILNGSFMFAADLVRAMPMDCDVSFVKMQSYSGMQSSGEVKELMGFSEKVEGRHVVLVEDIVETGISMEYTLKELWKRKPASVAICTFFFKPHLFHRAFRVDYVGRSIGDDFIVGYGLDYNGKGRTYKDVYVVE